MSQRGFSLLELLIAAAISALVAGALVAAVAPARAAFESTPAAFELQQRTRLGFEYLASALRSAGAIEPGRFLPAMIPAIASARSGAFSEIELFSEVPLGARGVLDVDQPSPAAALTLASGRGCVPLPDVCGFTVGKSGAITDSHGRFDIFEVASIDPATMRVTPLEPLSASYGKDTLVFEAEAVRFFLVRQPDGSTSLARMSRTSTAQPIVDGVTRLAIALWGEAAAPQLTWDGTNGWSSYGPGPPAATFQDALGAWPPGESCAVARDTSGPLSRLNGLGPPGSLVPLPPGILNDGPWCATGALGWYDLDLIRLRRVDVSIALESLTAALRAPAARLFTNHRELAQSIYLRNQR